MHRRLYDIHIEFEREVDNAFSFDRLLDISILTVYHPPSDNKSEALPGPVAQLVRAEDS